MKKKLAEKKAKLQNLSLTAENQFQCVQCIDICTFNCLHLLAEPTKMESARVYTVSFQQDANHEIEHSFISNLGVDLNIIQEWLSC